MNKDFFKLGIVGNPLKHSISPLIQMAALDSVGLYGTYEKFEVSTDNLPEQIKYFKDNGYSGFNVTIPYKVEIIKYLNEVEENAQKIGAVNTVKISDDGKLLGYNTDIYGFINSIPAKYANIKNATLLGCGGAALAVVMGLDSLGCENITVCARNFKRAEDFVKSFSGKTEINFTIQDLSLLKLNENTNIVINATPLGTLGEYQNKMPVMASDFKTLNKNAFIYDLIYNPSETMFLNTAKQFDFKYTNGLNMLILQGAKAFEIWTDIYPDTNKMFQAYSK